MDLQEVGWIGLDWNDLAQDRDSLWALVNAVMNFQVLDFKLLSCSECCMFSSGLFPGVCSLNANVSEHSVCSIFIV
jgi:hypothetical protein